MQGWINAADQHCWKDSECHWNQRRSWYDTSESGTYSKLNWGKGDWGKGAGTGDNGGTGDIGGACGTASPSGKASPFTEAEVQNLFTGAEEIVDYCLRTTSWGDIEARKVFTTPEGKIEAGEKVFEPGGKFSQPPGDYCLPGTPREGETTLAGLQRKKDEILGVMGQLDHRLLWVEGAIQREIHAAGDERFALQEPMSFRPSQLQWSMCALLQHPLCDCRLYQRWQGNVGKPLDYRLQQPPAASSEAEGPGDFWDHSHVKFGGRRKEAEVARPPNGWRRVWEWYDYDEWLDSKEEWCEEGGTEREKWSPCEEEEWCEPCPAATEQENKVWYAWKWYQQNGTLKPCKIPMKYTPCRYHSKAKSCLGEGGSGSCPFSHDELFHEEPFKSFLEMYVWPSRPYPEVLRKRFGKEANS